MKGSKTEGGRERVDAMAVVIFWRRVPVRDQAVSRAGRRVAGQWEAVLTVMICFSDGIWEKPSSLAAAPLAAAWVVFSEEVEGRAKNWVVRAKRDVYASTMPGWSERARGR